MQLQLIDTLHNYKPFYFSKRASRPRKIQQKDARKPRDLK